MAYYESVFIARQEISAQQADALADSFTGVIEENGGKVTKRESWGVKSLAYRIKKNRKGHYMMFNIDGPSSAVQEMERQMRLNEDILRILTVKVDELEEGPSAQMQGRSGRDGRYDDNGDRSRRASRNDRAEGTAGTGADAKPEAKVEAKPEAEVEAKPEAKVEAKPEAEEVKAEDKPDKDSPDKDSPDKDSKSDSGETEGEDQ